MQPESSCSTYAANRGPNLDDELLGIDPRLGKLHVAIQSALVCGWSSITMTQVTAAENLAARG